MQTFTYNRTAAPLRTTVASFGLLLLVDIPLVAGLILLVPRPWNWPSGIALLLLAGWGLLSLTKVLRTRHRLTDSHLHIRFGAFALAVPRQHIQAVSAVPNVPPGISGSSVTPEYRPADDTVYIVGNRRGLVRLELTEPLPVRMRRGQYADCSAIVLSLDEPAALLQALGATAEPLAAPGPARPPQVGASPRQLPEERMDPDATPAIALHNLTRRFGDFTAVDDVSLTVAPGEIVAFLGSNGAGKTTTIRMMTGLLRPSAGHVRMLGRDVWTDGPAARRAFGYVPDVPLLYEGLTGREFLWLIGGLYSLARPHAERRATELLDQTGLIAAADRLIRHYSLGMKRKLAIAAALVHSPLVLLLDEVTNGLDPRSARDIKDFIRTAATGGAAVFLTTHILDVAAELANRFAVIHGGRLQAVGTWPELVAAAGLGTAALTAATLEDVFLTLTDAPGVGVQ